jgi:hypothetical protein
MLRLRHPGCILLPCDVPSGFASLPASGHSGSASFSSNRSRCCSRARCTERSMVGMAPRCPRAPRRTRRTITRRRTTRRARVPASGPVAVHPPWRFRSGGLPSCRPSASAPTVNARIGRRARGCKSLSRTSFHSRTVHPRDWRSAPRIRQAFVPNEMRA